MMPYTVKFRSYVLSKQQPPPDCVAPSAFYDEVEQIHGPFDFISKEMDDGYVVVHCHRGNDPGYSFGPIKPALGDGPQLNTPHEKPRPTVWVMNENGATVARYDL